MKAARLTAFSDEEFLRLDPELDQLFRKRGIPALPLPTRENIGLLRAGYSKVIQRLNNSPFAEKSLALPSGNPTWTERDESIPVRDGSRIKIRIYIPHDLPEDGSPVALMEHGGGWCMGDLETDAFLCRLFCSKFGLVMVNVDFRMYPEVNFPIPITDCYDALKWTASNASNFGGNLQKGFIVGGTSGGGTFASIATHLARDENFNPPLTGCFLLCPILSDFLFDGHGSLYHRFGDRIRSQEQNKNAPLMTRGMQDAISKLADFDWKSPLFTPFQFPRHNSVCPTYIQVCGLDPWRDSGIMYGEVLRDEGVAVKLDAYPGLPHMWWTTFWMLKANQKWLDDVQEGMRWLLKSERVEKAARSTL